MAEDFSVGNADKKLGKDLAEDYLRKDCDGADHYDETHALLSDGLIGGLLFHDPLLIGARPLFSLVLRSSDRGCHF